MKGKKLHDALKELHPAENVRNPVVRPLPLTHATKADALDQILASGSLEPSTCEVFGNERLYLYYGGIYYRSSFDPTHDKTKLPVAFVFGPRVLTELDCCFPFDTGALQAEIFGPVWKKQLQPSDRFKVVPDWGVETTGILVMELYASNAAYIDGVPDPASQQKIDPLPELFEFLADDLTQFGSDERQRRIECHYQVPIELKEDTDLLWVGYPRNRQDFFTDLCDRFLYPSVPSFYTYSFPPPFRPGEIEGVLHAEARKVINRFLS